MKIFLYFFIPLLLLGSYILIQFIHNYIPMKIPYTFTSNISKEKVTSTIRLLVWNIHKENHEGEFKNDLHKINKEYQPNFTLLQEYLYHNQNTTIENSYTFSPNLYQSSSGNFSGIVNIFDIPSKKNIPILSKGLEPILSTPKIALATIHPLNKLSDLMIVNIHALNFQLDNKAFKEQMENITKSLDMHLGPKIFAGDFNTWSKTRIDILNNVIHASKMEAVKFQSEEKNIKSVFGNKLDHIFYSAESLRVIYKKVIDDINSSDHAPLYIELEVL